MFFDPWSNSYDSTVGTIIIITFDSIFNAQYTAKKFIHTGMTTITSGQSI
jgi:hypothetical protein